MDVLILSFRLTLNFKDELDGMEARFGLERSRLEESRDEEVECLRRKLMKAERRQTRFEKAVVKSAVEAWQRKKYKQIGGNSLIPVRIKSSEGIKSPKSPSPKSISPKSISPIEPSFHFLRALFDSPNLPDVIDDESHRESSSLRREIRHQYETRLRNETDDLMKRLLELSDDLQQFKNK